MSSHLQHAQLILEIDKNKKNIEELTTKYAIFFKQEPQGKGLLGQVHDFRNLAALVEINELEKQALKKNNWDYVREHYSRIRQKIVEYFNTLLSAQKKLSSLDLQENRKNFELEAVKYLRALEAAQNCHLKLIEDLGKSINKKNFEAKYQFLDKEREWLDLETSKFKRHLEEVSETFIQKQITSPEKNAEIDLKEALDNLQHYYTLTYDTHYGESGFWRWIKNLLQNSDRVKEVNFLATLSKHPDCTDAVRMQAIFLVHNKINASELFAQGSKLKDILRGLSESNVHVREHDDNLAHFLSEHPDLGNLMPKNLRNYYDDNSKDYQKIGSATLLQ
ncbi:hypothetical protein [Legionella brunensis]|uniref:Uncharacterized protein n=1 Tax=Legionella brunensis TaxID=29422 RepID=A0A0W0SIA5_9GAMM|nr:hypothetical protein [Legionella brunensis]KTC82980.1 hypothetical protein Lbru_1718 [Legionella brunensis]